MKNVRAKKYLGQHFLNDEQIAFNITNLLNDRSILVKVGVKADYPDFFNSVISQRIAEELKLSIDEPYIQITELAKNSHFIANESKMFEEEKNVATKVPVDEIKVSNLSEIVKPKTKKI